MPQDPLQNPINTFRFFVDIGDLKAYFTEVSGFDNNTEVIEHRQANNKGDTVIMKLPGKHSWGDITIKRAYTNDNALHQWRELVLKGDMKTARKNGTITGYDEQGTPILQFTITACWPTKYKGPSFSAKSNDPAIEEVALTHEGLVRSL